MRAVIVFDTSGSMRTSDPQRLSQEAAHLFVSLARTEDAIGMVSFSDQGVPLMPLTSLHAPATKTRLQALLKSIAFTGQTTDLAAALEAGLASFPPGPATGSRDLVLLLTDGQLDLGPRRRAEEPGVLAHIQQTLLPQYRERAIALYTIAFTRGADQSLLQEMAQTTRGAFHFISNAAELHKAFRDLFIVAQQSESLPLLGNTVLLDDSIQEAQLILSKRDKQEQIKLVTPQQESLDAHTTHPGMAWTSTPAYDLVHITHPQPGLWQVNRSDNGAEAIGLVAQSTLSLHIALSPAYREVGEPVSLTAFLEENGQRLREPSRLQQLTVSARLTSPRSESRTLTLAPQKDGEFAVTLSPLPEPGHYDLLVLASGTEFRRQRTSSFTLHPRCFQPAVTPGPPVMLQVTLAATCAAFRTLLLEAGHAIGGSPPLWTPLTSPQPGLFTVQLPPPAPGQPGEVRLRIRGELDAEGAFNLLKGPWPLPAPTLSAAPPSAPPPETQGGQQLARLMLGKFLALNGVLGLAGGSGYGIYIYLRRRRTMSHD
jgi:hypothetical protein